MIGFSRNGLEVRLLFDENKGCLFIRCIQRFLFYFLLKLIFIWRVRWERLKDWFRFPDYLPIVRHFVVADQKIYILTYKVEKEKFQFLVLDTDGKHLKTVFLPLNKEKDDVFGFTPFCIKNGILYQLIETEDDEWELHATAIQ